MELISMTNKASHDNTPIKDNKVASNSYKPWLTKSLICCINMKNYMYGKFYKRSISTNKFNIKNKLTGIIKIGKKPIVVTKLMLLKILSRHEKYITIF